MAACRSVILHSVLYSLLPKSFKLEVFAKCDRIRYHWFRGRPLVRFLMNIATTVTITTTASGGSGGVFLHVFGSCSFLLYHFCAQFHI